MTEPIPTSAADVDRDFDANASPPPEGDPGHLAELDEWAAVVARAESSTP